MADAGIESLIRRLEMTVKRQTEALASTAAQLSAARLLASQKK